MAPTGVAAENVEGHTYHSYFGVHPNKQHYTDFHCFTPKVKEKLRRVQVLIFDEISMISGETLDLLNVIAQNCREETTKPFGGLQVVLVGDFCQLLPIGYNK